jgi:hypothetical protein
MTLGQRDYEIKHKADALTRQIGKEWNFEIYTTEKLLFTHATYICTQLPLLLESLGHE